MNYTTGRIITWLVIIPTFLNTVLFYMAFISISVTVKDSQNTIARTILAYEEMDLVNICAVSKCTQLEVVQNGVEKSFEATPTGGLRSSHIRLEPDEEQLSAWGFEIRDDLSLVFREDTYGILLRTDRREILNDRIDNIIIINVIAFFAFLLVNYLFFRSNRLRQMALHRNLSETAKSKNMKVLTENMLHELRTPITIIDGTIHLMEKKVERIRNTVQMCGANRGCLSSVDTMSFQDVYDAIARVSTVLDRIGDFKQITYSNGNKNVFDILRAPTKNMETYKHCIFSIDVPEELQRFKLRGNLSNGDLMNITSSHVKNAIEAKASAFLIEFKYCKKKKLLHLFFIDKGHGVRGSNGLILPREQFDLVFKEGYTTKDESGHSFVITEDISWLKKKYVMISYTLANIFTETNKKTFSRGSGLGLNRWMLRETGGNLILRETTAKGTVFELIVQVEEKE